ncbi:SDR family NAD(P)-dependent oxidoreductase [Novosphingobium sp. JCM 18896]|uniref:SDR family NAD(P)-dependent oxidoreductase n=1 Tax=Novosphingobium sp. JCM 18896 TaxID=2989731 RepID=UPI002222447A|nr:SDR family oxidoreductase [Novosphingobium sp. JCM 18896]MCW1427915.1 SDR family oxidoreductase [Novosphingobium sp. JCM 18896]
MSDFAGRTALITGAASGIGAEIARWLDARGIGSLVLVDIDAAGLAALELGCQVVRHAGDVSDPALWETIEAGLDRLDHAVINAGVANGAPLAEFDWTEWRRIMSINLDGAFLGLRTALRAMKASQGKSLVLTSSVVGVKATANTGAYGASKAAVCQLAKIAAAEDLADGIRVNAIAPGRVDTPIWTKTDHFRQLEAELGREAALRTLGKQTGGDHAFTTAAEIAGQIGFLLSDAAANVTGQVLVSDGGYSL